MISYIMGKVTNLGENSIVVECKGMGYKMAIPTSSLSKVSIGEYIKIYTYMYARDDSISLFGFLTQEEVDIFNKLITVTGVGAKSATGMLSILSPSQIILAIITEDVKMLSKAPGIGKKTAQRLILELKDKIKPDDAVDITTDNIQESLKMPSNKKQDAIDALIALGYSRAESVKAVIDISIDEKSTVEQIIKQSLKKLSF